jgi:anaerobic selenocysteine-containing dehydrogenase
MGEEGRLLDGFSRRSFIKGAAVLAATGVLAGCTSGAPGDDAGSGDAPDGAGAGSGVSETTIYAGVCQGNCNSGCAVDIHVRDGRAVRTTAHSLPDARYDRICTKGITSVARVYSAERIQYPMRRTGERGQGEFERISWEEAIQEITDKWIAYTDEYGPEAMAINGGSGNLALHGGVARSLFQNATGASQVPLNMDAAHARTYARMTGLSLLQTNNEATDLVNSKTVICWGSNPAVSQPQFMHFIQEAQEQGARYIVIDPVCNTNAARADWFIPINVSTDGALALGALCEVFANDWQDLDFLRAHTEAPFLIKADGMFLHMSDVGVEPQKGEVDPATGEAAVIDPYAVWDESKQAVCAYEEATLPTLEQVAPIGEHVVKTVYEVLKEQLSEWSVERASEITGVSAEDIRELARVYHEEGPVNTYAMFGSDHYVNGTYNYGPMYTLILATGNIGKPGAGIGQNLSVPSNVANFANVLYPTDSEGNTVQGPGILLTATSVPDVLKTGMFGDHAITLKGIYLAHTNPVTTHAERKKTVEWLTGIEFLVVADMVMSESARYADILLPVCHWYETTNLYANYANHAYLLYQEKALEPLYESKSDWEIYGLIADKLGCGSFFNMSTDDYIAQYLDSDGARDLGITFERLIEEKALRFLPKDPYISFEGGVFTTPTTRARFYFDELTPDYNIGQPIDEAKERTALYWEPAREADLSSPARQTYPFSVLSDHLRTRTHSQWWDVAYMKDYEPEPLVRINPDDAAELGIAEGDSARMFNDRGSVVLKVTINPGLPRKMVSSPRSFQLEEFIEGHFADLSSNYMNQVCANHAVNDVAVAIEKV